MKLEFFLNNIKSQLPLQVDKAIYNDPSLLLGGKNWTLNTLSSWRVATCQELVFGFDYNDAGCLINSLVGRQIVAVSTQGTVLTCDPVFTFDNGLVLEIFSGHFLEPWVMRLPDGSIFVASPTDKTINSIEETKNF